MAPLDETRSPDSETSARTGSRDTRSGRSGTTSGSGIGTRSTPDPNSLYQDTDSGRPDSGTETVL